MHLERALTRQSIRARAVKSRPTRVGKPMFILILFGVGVSISLSQDVLLSALLSQAEASTPVQLIDMSGQVCDKRTVGW